MVKCKVVNYYPAVVAQFANASVSFSTCGVFLANGGSNPAWDLYGTMAVIINNSP